MLKEKGSGEGNLFYEPRGYRKKWGAGKLLNQEDRGKKPFPA